jgi:hypothetical protein
MIRIANCTNSSRGSRGASAKRILLLRVGSPLGSPVKRRQASTCTHGDDDDDDDDEDDDGQIWQGEEIARH